MLDYLYVALNEKLESTYSTGRDLGDIDAESLAQTHGNSCSAHWSRGSSGAQTGDKSCEAQEESRSLLHDDLTDQLVISS